MIKKILRQYLLSRQERYYLKNRWHLYLDLGLGAIILVLATVLVTLAVFRPAAIDTSAPQHEPKTPASSPIDIDNPPLNLSFSLKESILGNQKKASLSIILRNDGAKEISDLKITFKSLDNAFSISRLEQIAGPSDSEISGSSIGKINIGAKSSQTLDLAIPITVKQAGKRVMSWQAESLYSLGGQTFKQTARLSDIKLAADLDVKASAFYSSPQGDQLGSGPLPPIVGLPTRYWIFLEASSSADLENIAVSAQLPPAVSLTDQQAVLDGEMEFQPSSRQIVWKIKTLKAEDGPARLNFALEIIPTANQAGKAPLLLNAARYVALDPLTGLKLAGQVTEITTELIDDKLNSGHGTVVANENE